MAKASGEIEIVLPVLRVGAKFTQRSGVDFEIVEVLRYVVAIFTGDEHKISWYRKDFMHKCLDDGTITVLEEKKDDPTTR